MAHFSCVSLPCFYAGLESPVGVSMKADKLQPNHLPCLPVPFRVLPPCTASGLFPAFQCPFQIADLSTQHNQHGMRKTKPCFPSLSSITNTVGAHLPLLLRGCTGSLELFLCSDGLRGGLMCAWDLWVPRQVSLGASSGGLQTVAAAFAALLRPYKDVVPKGALRTRS